MRRYAALGLTVYTQDDHNKMPLLVGHLALFAARSEHELGPTGIGMGWDLDDINNNKLLVYILASDGG